MARLVIRPTQHSAETTGSRGTEGVRNGRFMRGRVRRSTITAMETTKNANSVPMLTISASASSGTKPASSITTAVVPRVTR